MGGAKREEESLLGMAGLGPAGHDDVAAAKFTIQDPTPNFLVFPPQFDSTRRPGPGFPQARSNEDKV